jgi:two-component SAPR family response regulator
LCFSTQAQCHSEDYKKNQQRHQIFKAITTTQATKRILIVDDEADINFMFKVVLQNDGFKVDSFSDPLLALEDFKSRIYDLVLLDIVMPVINGFELYEKIKKIDNKVKICFLTASANYCLYEGSGKEAFPDLDTKNAFIYKPIENTEMI